MKRLAAMEAFVLVVDAGSFSAAARQLRIGQPAVSKAIAQLEQYLGHRLLLRTTHGLSPTESGRIFYEHAKRAIASAEDAVLAARAAGAGLSGRLRVSAAPTFARFHVMPHLPVFLKAHPRLEIDLLLEDRNIDLVEQSIDVALRLGPQADSASLTARRIAQGGRHVIGIPEYFDKIGLPIQPEDLLEQQAIIYHQGRGGDTWRFRQGSFETSIPLRGRVRSTAAEGVREAVLSGLGFTIASSWMFAPELKSGRVRTVLDDWTLPPSDLWAVSPTGRQLSAKSKAFISFIENCLATPL